MLTFSPTPVTDTNVSNRTITTHYDLALTDDTLHRVRVSTSHNRDTRQIISFAERVAVTSPSAGILVTNHDPDLYATLAYYPCRKYSPEALAEAHADALERMAAARAQGTERITVLFRLCTAD